MPVADTSVMYDSPRSLVSMSKAMTAFAPRFLAFWMARATASLLAFSISVVKAVISPPPMLCRAPLRTPPTPRVLGLSPLTMPYTWVTRYPGTVGVVVTLNSCSDIVND